MRVERAEQEEQAKKEGKRRATAAASGVAPTSALVLSGALSSYQSLETVKRVRRHREGIDLSL